jgi:phosphatidylglycerophosphatase A
MTNRVATIIGTFFGAGYFPKAPGTAGSAAALLIYLAARPALSGWWLIVAAALLYAPAVWAAGVCEKVFQKTDPGQVVIDEVIGQAITLAVIPASAAGFGGWKLWLTGFILFRGFDMAKPFPIRRLEKLPGGYGIVTDDVLAGIYGAVVLKAALHFGGGYFGL